VTPKPRKTSKQGKAIPRQELDLRSIYAKAPIGLCCMDTDLRYVYINEWLAAINGLGVEEHLGRTIGEVLPDVAAGVEAELRHVIESGDALVQVALEAKTAARSEQTRRFENSYYPVRSDDGSVVGVSCVVQDVTERRLAESKTSEMESIFSAFPDLGFRLDREGTILSYYAGSQSLLYLPPEKFLGKPLQKVLPPEVGNRFEEAILKLNRRGAMQRVEYRLQIGGEDRYWEARLLPLPGEDIFAIIRELTHQKRLEKDVLESTHREQVGIGQELHDGIGQEIRGLGYLAKSLSGRLESRGAEEARDAIEVAEGLQRVLGQLQAVAKGLIPVDVDASGLMVALKELAQTATERFGCVCRFECPRPVSVDNDQVALHLFRIAQEALNNSIKHADATLIVIRLEVRDGRLVLEVRDDGSGLEESPTGERGLGFQTMQYRAALIGASHSVARVPTGGTLVRCLLDL
jgi:two-component system sensor kinase FixL